MAGALDAVAVAAGGERVVVARPFTFEFLNAERGYREFVNEEEEWDAERVVDVPFVDEPGEDERAPEAELLGMG